MGTSFKGIIPPVTTPFSEEGSLLFSALEGNVQNYLRTSLSGFLLLGSNGESVHLSRREKLEIVGLIAPALPSDRYLFVGLNFATEQESLSFLESLSAYRIDAVLTSVPSYYKNRMNGAALRDYFFALAEHSPFPLLLYNVPQYSGVELAPALIGEVAGHEKIVGMKDSSGSLIYLQRVLRETAGKDFQVLLGSASVLGPSLVLGIQAAILAVACALPDLPIRILEDFRKGRDIRQRQLELSEITAPLTSTYGVAGLKFAMDLAGLEGQWCRRPLLPLSRQEKSTIRQCLAPVLGDGRSKEACICPRTRV
ncbi:MAG: dihydrodipicolinate synthase family protein [Acidobacteriota bacterium]